MAAIDQLTFQVNALAALVVSKENEIVSLRAQLADAQAQLSASGTVEERITVEAARIEAARTEIATW